MDQSETDPARSVGERAEFTDVGRCDTVHVDLVVPAYNEAGNLRRTIERTTRVLRERADGWTFGILLVVSDGSDDGTQVIAADLDEEFPEVSRLVRTERFGFGNALKDGLAHADGDVLIPFMADLSDDPADVPAMVDRIEEGYDVVYGSRFHDEGSVEGYPLLKLLYNRLFNNGVRLLFGIGHRDITNAFTAYRREVIQEVDPTTLASESFDITAELPLRATVEGFRIFAVPVSWHSREAGVSKLNATQKGPVYAKRVATEFVRGNLLGLRDLFGAVTDQNLGRALGAGAFGILLLLVLLSLTGFSEVLGAVFGADPVLVGVVAVVYLSSFVFRTWRWRVLLRASGHSASRANVFRCIMAGWFFNSLIPARAGDVIRGYALKTTEGVPFGVGASTIVIERVMDMLVLASLMGLIVIVFLSTRQTAVLAAGAALIGAALLVGLAVVYVLGDAVAARVEGRIPGIGGAIRNVQTALRRVSGNPYAVALAALVSVPVWVAEVGTVVVAARAVGVSVGIVPTVTAGVAAFVSQTVPLTPGGLGTYETAITSVLAVFGVSATAGTALAFVDHFTRLLVTYVVGLISAVHLVFQSRPYFRAERETDEGEAGQPTME